ARIATSYFRTLRIFRIFVQGASSDFRQVTESTTLIGKLSRFPAYAYTQWRERRAEGERTFHMAKRARRRSARRAGSKKSTSKRARRRDAGHHRRRRRRDLGTGVLHRRRGARRRQPHTGSGRRRRHRTGGRDRIRRQRGAEGE